MNNSEQHPLPPFLPPGATALMLGSFPPPGRRWTMNFYYPNFQNDMWRIFGLVFFGDSSHFIAADGRSFCETELRNFLADAGIALSDTAAEVNRLKANASDRFLDIVAPVDLDMLLAQLPACRTLITTGQKATETLARLLQVTPPPTCGAVDVHYADRQLRFYRMPSSSRAYPMPLASKAAAYGAMFAELGIKSLIKGDRTE